MSDKELHTLWTWLQEHERRELEFQKEMFTRLRELEDTIAQQKGAARVLTYFSAVLGVVGGWIASHYWK